MQLYILIKACVVSPCTSVLSSNSLASNSEVPYTLYLSSPPLTSTTDKGWGLFVFCVNCRCVCGENSTSQFTVNLPMFVSVHIYPPACRHGVTGLAACSRCSTLQQMWCLFEVTVPLGFFFFSLVTFYPRVAAPPFPFRNAFLRHWIVLFFFFFFIDCLKACDLITVLFLLCGGHEQNGWFIAISAVSLQKRYIEYIVW